ncbi:hypothetical protein GTA51_06730 [Desulfovibrio aerotolerans]|uniref:Uncharacterized protein n=1 Tax=Solidesulfovibrio aerotolerans TaxID=295255 RepID=A0A7C9MEQ4_9BACT|nr:hypothetical protein [Solidesulfovibrio aerotolerans]MYL82830.1 hypothetical protein [Solidesulfovibrio aerotolerans]
MHCLVVLASAVLCLALSAGPLGAAEAPSQLAGIAMGANAEDMRDRLDLARVAPLWDKPWLVRANLKPTKGFIAGYVLLGGCATQNRVERIRLQYKDGSKALFDKLTRTLTDRYGVPLPLPAPKAAKYKGFRWVFGANKSKGMDILLEHFEETSDENPSGNVIRMTDNRAMAQERTCYDAMIKGAPEPQPAFPLFEVDDKWLLPQ